MMYLSARIRGLRVHTKLLIYMKNASQAPGLLRSRSLSFLFMLVTYCSLLLMPGWARGQTKILANEVTHISGNKGILNPNPTVIDPSSALVDNENYATLLSSPGTAVSLGNYDGVIELQFSSMRPADSWAYVRIGNEDKGLLDALLGGSLGGVLKDVVGVLAGGSQVFTVDARNGSGSPSDSRNSNQGFNTDRFRLIQDVNGNNYIAIRPSAQFNRIRITNSSTFSVLGAGKEFKLRVYNAFYYENNGGDCGLPTFTSFDGSSGLGLTVLDLGDQNLENAIDNNENSFSLLKSTGTIDLSVARSFSQYFYYPTVSPANSSINIKIALGSGGVVNTDLLGGIEVVFWNGSDQVYKRSLQSGLLNNTDVLNILKSGNAATLTFASGYEFNRVEVRLNSTVGLSVLGNGVRIYDVQRYDGTSGCVNPLIGPEPAPTAGPFEKASCATTLVDFGNVDFPHNAIDENNETFARLYADAGGLLVSGPTAGFIEMDLGATVPANKTTYVRVNYDEDVLDRLLGGSLGKLISDLANNLLLGNQYFRVQAKNGMSEVLNSVSSNAFEGNANGVVTLVQDNIGRYYIAITPNQEYNRIRITNHVTALLATGKKASLDVYNACFEIGTDACFPANFTSYKGGGIGLNVGNISSAGVENPYRAISANPSEYSKINLGIAGVAANVYQTIYFNQPSQAGDKVKIRLQVEPSSLLSLDVLGAYKIKFFNGKDQVGSDYRLQAGLLNNIDLLALFKAGGIVELEFEPTGTFDRVDIGAESIVSVNVAAEPLRVYSVKRFGTTCPETKEESPFVVPSCASILIDAQNANDLQNLFDDDFGSYATLNSGAGILLGLGNKHEGFVELGYNHMVPAGTTSYIRVDFEDSLLEKLLGGSLGNVVSGLVNGLVLGDHFFEVEVKNNGTRVDLASSQMSAISAGGNSAVRIVRDKDGRYYIAVSPTDPYNSVRITDKTNSALGLLAEPNTMNVYGMCYETSTDACLDAFSTSYEYSGLALSVNDLGGAGVTNPQYALNDNTTSASQISMGTLNIAGGAKQWIFFNSVSAADDVAMIKFKTGAGGIDVSVLGDLKIKAYLGNTEVATVDWGTTGIINGINVLNLINNGDIVALPFAPGKAYDRISVGIENLATVSVFPPVELYSVTRCFALDKPEFIAWKSADQTSVKGGEEITYTIHVRNTGTRDLVGYLVEDKIPVNTTYVAGSGGIYNSATNTVSFENVTVLAGEQQAYSFKVKVDADLTGVQSIRNVAVVKNSPSDKGTETFPPSTTDPNQPDNSGETGTEIPVDAVKSVVSWKAHEVDGDKTITTVSGGEEVTYHIYVRNTGNQDLTNVEITDVLPAKLTWKSGGQYDVGTRTVKFNIASLAVGATSVAQSIVVTVDKNLSGITEIKNIAIIKTDLNSPDPGVETFPPVDNVDPIEPNTTTPNPGTVLEVTAVHAVSFLKTGVSNNLTNIREAEEGNEITYSLTVKNIGNKDLTGVYITDEVPENTTYVSGGNEINGVVSILVGDLAYGKSKTVTFIVKVGSLTADPANPVTAITNVAEAHFKNGVGGDETVEATHVMQANCTEVNAGNVAITPNGVFCEGSPVTLTATVANVAGTVPPTDFVVKWFADAALTDYLGEGASLNVIPVAGSKYYAILEHDGYCFDGDAAEYEVGFLSTAIAANIDVGADGTYKCEGEEAILVAEASGITNPQFRWYVDAELTQPLTANNADGSELRFMPTAPSTTVYVTVSGDGICENKPNEAKAVTINVNKAPVITLSGSNIIYVATGAPITWPTASTPSGSIQWYDHEGKPIDYSDLPPSINAVTQRSYTVVATNGTCSSSETIIVNVFDGKKCPPQMERVYATVDKGQGSIITGGVDDTGNATDGNPKTHSTIVTGLGLLGIGTTWQNIEFDHEVPAGTPVTIKLGKEYSGLVVAGGLSVVGTDANGNNIGTLKSVDGGLLDLLAADNVVEFTFVPSNSSGPQKYHGVRISSGALLSVAQLSKVYGVYYTKPGQADCTPIDNETNPDVLDVLHGVEDLGLGVLSATASVVQPWNAVDNDLNTSAKIVRGVSALNAATLTVVFKNQVMPTDSLRLIMKDPTSTGLSLNLLTGYRFQRFNGSQKAGAPIQGGDVLNLKLLNFTSEKAKLTISSFDQPYDRLQIGYGSVVEVNLGNQVEIFDVAIQPAIKYGAIDGNFEICAGEDINFEVMDECTTYEIYDKDGNTIGVNSGGLSFTIPNTTLAGEHTYYVQAVRYGCAVGVRIPITITVNPTVVIERIELNGQVRTNNEITLAPGENFEGKAIVSTNGAKVTRQILQMLDEDGDWISPDFGASVGDFTARFNIPADGVINGKDYRNESVQFRMIFSTNKCETISDVMTLHISASKYDFTGENLQKVAKEGPNTKAVAGEEFVYTVTVKNGGPSTITAGTILFLQDIPSAGQTLDKVVATSNNIKLGGGNSQGGYFITAESDIVKGDTFTLDVTTLVDPAIVANFVENTFKIWTKDPNGNYNDVNNPADGSVTSPQYGVIREYGFDDDAITKVGQNSNENAVAGQPYTYTVTVENKGPSTILNGTPIYFQDVLSPGQKLTGVTSTDGTANVDLQTGMFNLTLNKAVAAGSSFTLEVTADVPTDIVEDEISNTIHIWQNNPGTDIITLPAPDGTATTPNIPVERDYNWGDPEAVKKDGNALTATAGEVYTYTVTLTNKGTSTILPNTALYLQDAVSAGQSITQITPSNGAVGTVNPDGSFILTVADAIATNATIELEVEVLVASDIAANIINNTINIWSKDPAGDYTQPEGTATTPDIPVNRDYNWGDPEAVKKVGDAATATAGNAYTYTVTLTNKGTSTILSGTTLYLQDAISAGQTISKITSSNGTVGTVNTDGSFTLEVADAVATDESIELTVEVEVASDIVADIINNTINIWSVDPNGDYSSPEGTATTLDIPVDRDYGWNDPDAVLKEGDAITATAGKEFTYTVTLTNKGASTILPTATLYLQDVVELGQTIKSITSEDANVGPVAANGTFTLNVNSPVATGQHVTLKVTVDVAADAPSTIKNTINIWTNDPGTDLTTPDGTDTTDPIPVERDYNWGDPEAVKKAGEATEATAGEDFNYTVTLINKGTSTILPNTVLYLQDVLSAGQTIKSIVSDNGTVGTIAADGAFTLTVANAVPKDTQIRLTVSAKVHADITANVINNTIHIWSKDPTGDYTMPEGTATTPDIPVNRDYNWGDPEAVKKVGDAATATAGNAYTYTVTLTNKGTSTILSGTTLYLQDAISAGQTISKITSSNGTVGTVNTDGSFTLEVADAVATDESIELTVEVEVASDIVADIINNTINIWSVDPNGDYSSPEGTATTLDIPVDRDYGWNDPDAVLKEGDAITATAGKEFTYTVTLTNKGASTILPTATLYLQDVVELGQTIKSITSEDANVGPVAANGTFTLNVNSPVATGQHVTLKVTVDVAADAPSTIKNTINIWTNDPGTDLTTPDGTDTTDPIPVDRDYGWNEPGAVLKEGGVTAVAGEDFAYTVTLTNKGTSTILDGTVLRLQDVVSTGQIITSIVSDKGVVSSVDANGFFTLAVNQDVAVAEQIKLTVVVDIDPDAQVTTVQNTINIWEDKTPITDVPDGTDTTDPIPVTFNAKFTVTKTTDATEAVAGEKVKYDVVLTNVGPSTAKIGKQILVIEKPGNMVITTADIKVMSGNAELDGNYDATTGEFTLKTTKDVKLTEQIVLEIYAMVPANATGMVKNGVKVDDDEKETPEIPVVDKVKFAVQKTVAAGQKAIAGESIDFDIVLTNNGPSTAKPGHKVLVIEKPSAFLTIEAADIKVTSGNANLYEGKYNEATGEFTLVVTNEVDLGATINMTVTAHIAEEATGMIKNGIKVEDEETETPPIPVDNNAKFGVKKTANKTEVFVGESVDFKVVLTNNGPSTAQIGHEIKVIETPDGMTITAADITVVGDNATFDGNYNQTTGEFTVKVTKPIAVGGTVELNIKGHVPLDAVGTVKNGIEVDKDTDVTPEIPVVNEAKMKIVKVADENTVKAGEMTTFTLTITNQGPAAVQPGKTIELEERPGEGLSIKNYEMISSNATVQESDNKATLTTKNVIAVGEEIKIRVHVLVSEEAPEKVTNGISVWGPGKEPGTDPEDDKDDTPEVPVVYPLIQAVDDVAETKTAVAVEIDVLANDIVTKWDINPTSLEVVSSSVGATVTVGIDGKVTYISSREMIGEDTFTYRVKDIKGRWSNTAIVRVAVMNNDLDIPNIITPNGDGKNDEFRIKGLELYDRVGLTIVNRWGNEVYKSNAYNNDWSGAGLSEGTYFYVLELVKGGKSEVQKGWVTIKSN